MWIVKKVRCGIENPAVKVFLSRMSLAKDNGFDAASISSKYLEPHWLERILEDCEDEDGDGWVIQLLDGKGRHAVWCTCEALGARKAGVAAQACRLLERYLSKKLRTTIALLEDREHLEAGAWDAWKRTLGARLPLLMASCAKLAGKMNSSAIQLTAKKIRSALMLKGIAYSISEVVDAELEVFRTLNFRVPLWTSVEAAELLAQEVALPRSAFCLIPAVVELAEYRRDVIERRARWAADLSQSGKATMRSLHLAAGAVAAVEHLAGLTPSPVPRLLGIQFTPTRPAPDPLPRLALLVRATPTLIYCIYDLILEQILKDDASSDSSLVSIGSADMSD